MTPRLAGSTKWTAFPPELCDQIQGAFIESFDEASRRGQFFVAGRIYPDELLFRVGFLENGRLVQANFEVSMDFSPSRQNALEMIHFVVDCGATLLQEYFEIGEELDSFPRQWQAIEIEKKKIFIQVSTENSKLEAEADRILGTKKDDLVQGSDDDDGHKH